MTVEVRTNGLLHDNEQWEKTLTMYEHALLIEPHNADARTDMGEAYRYTGMSAKALAGYHQALACGSGQVTARYNLRAACAFDKKDYQSVISVWEERRWLYRTIPRWIP